MLLYDDAVKRKERQDHIYSKCLDAECTFQPDIIDRTNGDTDQIDVNNLIDRLVNPPKTINYSKIEYLQNEKFDKQTGMPLFHPQINQNIRNRDASPASFVDRLYPKPDNKKQSKNVESSLSQSKSAFSLRSQSKSKGLINQPKLRHMAYA